LFFEESHLLRDVTFGYRMKNIFLLGQLGLYVTLNRQMVICESHHERCKFTQHGMHKSQPSSFFTARCYVYAERGYATVCRPSVRLSVCLSVTLR